MMGRLSEFKTVPYFWSAMFGKTIRYAGGGGRRGGYSLTWSILKKNITSNEISKFVKGEN